MNDLQVNTLATIENTLFLARLNLSRVAQKIIDGDNNCHFEYGNAKEMYLNALERMAYFIRSFNVDIIPEYIDAFLLAENDNPDYFKTKGKSILKLNQCHRQINKS